MSLAAYKCCRGFRISPPYPNTQDQHSERKIHTGFFKTKFDEAETFLQKLLLELSQTFALMPWISSNTLQGFSIKGSEIISVPFHGNFVVNGYYPYLVIVSARDFQGKSILDAGFTCINSRIQLTERAESQYMCICVCVF